MSYCRKGDVDSDVYVIADSTLDGSLRCFCGDKSFIGERDEMVLHLVEHLQKGDKVPLRTFQRLLAEIREWS